MIYKKKIYYQFLKNKIYYYNYNKKVIILLINNKVLHKKNLIKHHKLIIKVKMKYNK